MVAELLIEPDVAAVVGRLSTVIEETANRAIERDGIFKIGLSGYSTSNDPWVAFEDIRIFNVPNCLSSLLGGSLVQFLCQGLPGIKTDWSKWRFFFCDERIVPFDSEDSTYGVYRTNLIGKIPIGENQFISVQPDLSPEEAAADYIKKMSIYFPPHSLPRFDLLLLGMGPDGHTCSLFPGHRLLEESSRWVCSINDSPKPPPSRITLTFPVINNAAMCIFAVAGAAKAEMVERIWKLEEDLPATRVRPTDGKLIVILDEKAAEKLPRS